MKKQVVYLAGGFNSNWREVVINLCDNFDFIDPKAKEEKQKYQANEYGCWDLHFIKQSDILFAYMEKSNPSGYGLSVEIGYAKALNKTVIIVLERGHEKDKYLQFLKSASDIVYEKIEDGIKFLKTFN